MLEPLSLWAHQAASAIMQLHENVTATPPMDWFEQKRYKSLSQAGTRASSWQRMRLSHCHSRLGVRVATDDLHTCWHTIFFSMAASSAKLSSIIWQTSVLRGIRPSTVDSV
eukprot:2074532-Amphidinium_carterae.1